MGKPPRSDLRGLDLVLVWCRLDLLTDETQRRLINRIQPCVPVGKLREPAIGLSHLEPFDARRRVFLAVRDGFQFYGALPIVVR